MYRVPYGRMLRDAENGSGEKFQQFSYQSLIVTQCPVTTKICDQNEFRLLVINKFSGLWC